MSCANVHTADVRASSIRNHDIKVYTTTAGILADETLVIRFFDSTLQSNPLRYIFTSAAQHKMKSRPCMTANTTAATPQIACTTLIQTLAA